MTETVLRRQFIVDAAVTQKLLDATVLIDLLRGKVDAAGFVNSCRTFLAQAYRSR